MTRFFLLLSLLSALPAWGAATWTCTRDLEQITASGALVAGVCVGAGTYTTGGDPISGGTSVTVADTATAVCGSPFRQVKDLIVTSALDLGNDNAMVVNFDHTARLLQLFTAGSATSSVRLVEFANSTSVASLTFRFVAACK